MNNANWIALINVGRLYCISALSQIIRVDNMQVQQSLACCISDFSNKRPFIFYHANIC